MSEDLLDLTHYRSKRCYESHKPRTLIITPDLFVTPDLFETWSDPRPLSRGGRNRSCESLTWVSSWKKRLANTLLGAYRVRLTLIHCLLAWYLTPGPLDPRPLIESPQSRHQFNPRVAPSPEMGDKSELSSLEKLLLRLWQLCSDVRGQPLLVLQPSVGQVRDHQLPNRADP